MKKIFLLMMSAGSCFAGECIGLGQNQINPQQAVLVALATHVALGNNLIMTEPTKHIHKKKHNPKLQKNQKYPKQKKQRINQPRKGL